MTGEFQGTSQFGSVRLDSAGARPDVFIAKLDRLGRVRWAKRFGDGDREIGRGIDADSKGRVYFSGEFQGTLQLGSTTLTSAGSDDMFPAKATSAGRVLWAISMGGAGDETGPEVETDPDGNSYLTATFSGTARAGTRRRRPRGRGARSWPRSRPPVGCCGWCSRPTAARRSASLARPRRRERARTLRRVDGDSAPSR